MVRIYLDACCLNRPFDDQTQARIRLESEAVLIVLRRCQDQEYEMVGSSALEFELSRIPDVDRQTSVEGLLALAAVTVGLTDEDLARAKTLEALGLVGIDALHVALAESSRADVFLTTDDRLLQKCSENSEMIRVKVANPVVWLTEVHE